MSLEARISDDLTVARRARDSKRVRLLGTLLSEVRNRRIAEGRDLRDDEVEQVVSAAVKQRREAAEQMSGGGREELADAERWEAEELGAYLPEPLSEEEVREIVREARREGAADVGSVMKRVMPRVRGRFDGREVNRIAREELAG